MMPVAVAAIEDTAGQGGENQGIEDDSEDRHVRDLPINEA